MVNVLVNGRAFAVPGGSIAVYLDGLLNQWATLAPASGVKLHLLVNQRQQVEYWRERGIETHFAPIRFNPVWENGVIPSLALRHHSDVVFFPKGECSWFNLPGVAYVTTIHGMIYAKEPSVHPPWVNWYWRLNGSNAHRRSRAIVVVSKSDRTDLLGLGYPAEKLNYIPIGIGTGFAQGDYPQHILRRYGLEPQDYLLQVAHFTNKKNQLFTLDMLQRLRAQGLHTKLVFVGGSALQPEYEQEVRRKASALGLADQVVYTGIIDGQQEPRVLPTLYHFARATIFPSLYEGFGIPCVESVAAGSPVVASDRGSLPEVLGAEFTYPLELTRWVDAVGALFHGTARNELLDAQRPLLARFDPTAVAQRYLDLFTAVGAPKG